MKIIPVVLSVVVLSFGVLAINVQMVSEQARKERILNIQNGRANLDIAVTNCRKTIKGLDTYLTPEWELFGNGEVPDDYRNLRVHIRDMDDTLDKIQFLRNDSDALELREQSKNLSAELKVGGKDVFGLNNFSYNESINIVEKIPAQVDAMLSAKREIETGKVAE